MNRPSASGSRVPRSTDSFPIRRLMKWVAVFLFAAFVVWAGTSVRMRPSPGTPLVRVTPETTFVTGPLNGNGDVDYIRYFNEQFFVEPRENAFVDLVEVIGPSPEGTVMPDQFFELLGIKPPASYGQPLLLSQRNRSYFVLGASGTLDEPLLNGVKLDGEAVFDITLDVPFPVGVFPAVDRHLEAVTTDLQKVREGVRKSALFVPWIGIADAPDKQPRLFDCLLPYQQCMRGIGRELIRSSMAKLGQNDISGAIDDQVAALRLGRLVAQRGCLIELMIGVAIEQSGHVAIGQTLATGRCTEADIEKLVRELDSLPPEPGIGREHLRFERCGVLDFTVHFGRNRDPNMMAIFSGQREPLNPVALNIFASITDWQVVMTELNRIYDRIDEILLIEDPQERKRSLELFIEELDQKAEEQTTSVSLALGLIESRASRGRLVASLVADAVLPALVHIDEVTSSGMARYRLTRIGMALEKYRILNGTFPRTLDELEVNEATGTIFTDPFSGQGFLYHQVNPSEYRLYSIGRDRVDGGGDPDNDLVFLPVSRNLDDYFARDDDGIIQRLRERQEYEAANSKK